MASLPVPPLPPETMENLLVGQWKRWRAVCALVVATGAIVPRVLHAAYSQATD